MTVGLFILSYVAEEAVSAKIGKDRVQDHISRGA